MGSGNWQYVASDHLGLALETNLISWSFFVLNLQWSEQAANAAAADVRSKDTKVKIEREHSGR